MNCKKRGYFDNGELGTAVIIYGGDGAEEKRVG
jgi:hypothetical protein